jgi:RHS repeat-associated protein
VDNNGTPNAPRVILTYGYDNFNNRTSIQDNSGATESLTYDSDNNLTNVSLSKSGWSNSNSVTLAYDTANRLTSVNRQWGNKFNGFTTVTSTYGYDNANRLTGITHKISGGSTLMTLTYGYDAANQLTSYSGPDGTITYGYDNDGQLTGASGAHNETYTYDKEGNRTMTGYVTSIGNRLTSDGTYSYTYDQDGNMLTQTRISDSQLTSYTWDFRNRLTEVLVKTSGGTTVQDDKFTYDIENRRIGKNTLSGGQSWTAYIDANPFMDFNSSGSLLYRYMYGNAIDFLIGRFDPSGNAIWYLTDKLGSVRENIDGSGNVLDSITYDTYGNILAETHPSSGDRFKYTGREWDSEIGQYYYRARYYGPNIGRFESEDPAGFSAGDTNLFRYVKNSPTIATDPTGLGGPAAGAATLKGTSIEGSLVAAIESGNIAQIKFILQLLAETGVAVSAGVMAAAHAKVAMAKAVDRKLGNLSGLGDRTVADVIRMRGGSAANVREAGEWAQETLKEAAEAAVNGSRTAEKAIKIAKAAKRLGQR